MEKNYKKLLKKCGRASADYNMLEEGDHVLIGLSGGIDSLMLSHILYDLQKRAPFDFKISTVTFNPLFSGFNINILSSYIKEQKWIHYITECNVKEILHQHDAQKRPCALCSRLRRGKLQELMRETKCNKLALGHHLDDVAASFLISLFRGQGITTMGPNVPALGGEFRIIRPLIYATKELINTVASKNFEFPKSGKCIYDNYLKETGDRYWAEQLIDNIDKTRIKDVRSAILNSLKNVQTDFLLDTKFLKDVPKN
ncbi:ATP-binding protein [Lentisphaerota bacterium WC36G]|nr:hypothetical protein LJT99_15990 [Lentisphaerae bacterium WC36]